MIKNTVCIDPGVHGGIAFNDGENIYVYNMPTIPPKSSGAEFTTYTAHGISEIIRMLPKVLMVWLERVGPRPSDTPKTAWRFSANYHCLIMSLWENQKVFKTQLPQHWQAQLGIDLPSGQNFYDVRKKLLKEFAIEKFPEVNRWKKHKGEWRTVKCKPTAQTADALCMLWVNAGFE